ncbi:MAG: cofactor-independent phosphoglycerate mutase [Actinomycetota bacterium]|nr:cofactor-independent phosphoglycerate mutase [Actinomycetota bacterium]
MKVAILVPDGAAGEPLPSLEGKTPLEFANTPNMDMIARQGICGSTKTIPEGMEAGSDVAILSLLGYDPKKYYSGRGPIEAASLGIDIPRGWTAFRCNLVTVKDGTMIDYSAGHISKERAADIISFLSQNLGDDEVKIYEGNSYRNILLLKGDYNEVKCEAPHDIIGEKIASHLPRGKGSERVRELMEKSKAVLECRKVNERLEASDSPPVTMIWLWGQGTAVKLESFKEKFGIEGGVVSAVDVVRGLARLAGLKSVDVPGMTGYLDTNYRGKGEAAIRLLEESDFAFVHVEAPDEASHMGDVDEKINAIERFDSMVVGPVLEFFSSYEGAWSLMVSPDHQTLISTRTHSASAVPFAACGAHIETGGASGFSEKAAMGGVTIEEGWKVMSFLLGGEHVPSS